MRKLIDHIVRNLVEADEHNPRIIITYGITTPESALRGDYAEQGFEDEAGVSMVLDAHDAEEGLTVPKKAVKFLQDNNAYETSSSQYHPGMWYISEPKIDFHTGEERELGFHLEGFTPEEEQAIFDRFTKHWR